MLSGYNIKLRDSNSEFRNFGDVLDDVAAQWDSYGTVAQNAIALAFSGVKQKERFLVLMENYGTSLKYAEIAANSAGTATEKYGAYLDGVEAHTNSLKAAFEALSTTLLDGDMFNGLIDAARVLINVFNDLLGNDIVQWFGLLNIALITTAGILGATTTIGLNGLAFALDSLMIKMGLTTGAATTLSMAFSTILPVAAVIGAVALFNKLNVTLEEQQAKLADIQAEYGKISSEVETLGKKESDGSITKQEKARLTFLKEYQPQLLAVQAQQERNTISSELFGTGQIGNAGLIGQAYTLGKMNIGAKTNQALSGKDPKKAQDVYGELITNYGELLQTQGTLSAAMSNQNVINDPSMLAKVSDAYDYVTKQIGEYKVGIDKIVGSGLVSYQADVAETTDAAAESVSGLSKSFTNFQTDIASVQTKSSALSSALQQQAADGYISAESLTALTEAGIDYKSAIDETSASVFGSTRKFSINTEKIQESLAANVELERSLLQVRKATDLETLSKMEASDASEADIANMKLQIAQYEALDEQLLSLISSIGAYKTALETANASADFDYATGDMLGTITEGLKSGRVATDEFKAAMSYFTDGSFGNALTQDSIPAMQKFFDGISQYTQGGSDGLNAATMAFQKKGLLDSEGFFKQGTTLTDAAKALGENVGTEFAYSLLKSYEDYGFDINIEDIMRPEDWDAIAGQVSKTADGFVGVYDKLTTLQSKLKKAQRQGNDEEVTRLTDQIQNLSSSLSSDEISSSINNLQSLLDSGKVSGDKATAIQDTIDQLNGLRDFKSQMDAIPITADDQATPIINSVSSALSALDGKTANTFITVTTTGSTTTSTGKVNGGKGKGVIGGRQIIVNGNANAGGAWGDGSGGKTLVGELGRELVVNPHTNSWYTVGENGTQFVNLPKNAIVFNHIQTEGILGNGSIFGRGKAMVSGSVPIPKSAYRPGDSISGGVKIIGGNPYTNGSSRSSSHSGGGSAAPSLSDTYEKEIKMLEHEQKLIEDLLNLYEEGSEKWFAQQQILIDQYNKEAQLAQAEYDRLLAAGMKASSDEMQELLESLTGYYSDLYDAQKDYWEAERDNAKTTLEHLKSQAEAVVDLKSSYHDLLKSVQSEQRDIDNQLKIAADAYPNLTEAERAAAFSGDDYQELSRKLASISAEAQTLYTGYLEQIQNVGEDASYELETITSEFERQYDLKLDQYNIAKAELGVLKARKNLENVKSERSVAMLIGGLWTWVSDSDNVISAMEDLSQAEQDLADSQSDATFNSDTANWESYISSIDNQISAIDALVYSNDALATEISDLVNAVSGQINAALSSGSLSLLSSLPVYSGTGTSLFSSDNLQNLFTASLTDALNTATLTVSTDALMSGILSNMASYTPQSSAPSTTHGDVLMWNGNVVAQGSDVTAFINILRALVPIFPVEK